MEITWNDLKKKMPYIKIIDIRENYLYNISKINNSVNVPFRFLILNPSDYLNKSETYYILCEFGYQSKMVSNILNKEGYHTCNISGGIKAYSKDNNKI